jgi:cell wall-associated NlpC family hydrolase
MRGLMPESPMAARLARVPAIVALVASLPGLAAAQNSTAPIPAPPVIEVEIPRDPRPFAGLSNTAMSMRDSVVVLARQQIGRRYRFGGTTPTGGFDCSGFVKYVLAALQISLPRTAQQQAGVGATVPKDTTSLKPGDLLTFGRGNKVTHIGIYVGDGRYVHASPKAGRVIETSLSRTTSPLVKIWRGGRRLLADATGSSDSVATRDP